LSFGARIFEKHVTLDRSAVGPDHPFALEFDEFTAYVAALRETHSFLGSDVFQGPSDHELNKRKSYLKSVIVRRNMKAGETLSAIDLYLARPGFGIPPRFFHEVVGSKLTRDVVAEQPLDWLDIEGGRLSES